MSKASIVWLVGGGALVGGLIFTLTMPAGDVSLRGRVADLLGYGGAHSDSRDHGRTLFHTGADIRGMKGGVSYAEFDRHRDLEATQSFFGFGCVSSCAEHEAGFRLAVRQAVSRPADCTGSSWSELEGCVAYALRKRS